MSVLVTGGLIFCRRLSQTNRVISHRPMFRSSSQTSRFGEDVVDEGGGGGGLVLVQMSGIVGAGNKQNDMIYHGPADPDVSQGNLVFFGGDIQDFQAAMSTREDSLPYLSRSLESTAKLLRSKFPDHNIWVVRPSLMHEGTWSSYRNFVKSDKYGVPKYFTDFGGFSHLVALLHSGLGVVRYKLQRHAEEERQVLRMKQGLLVQARGRPTDTRDVARLQTSYHEAKPAVRRYVLRRGDSVPESLGDRDPGGKLPLTLMGFSKGCVVLNQLLYEIYRVQCSDKLKEYLRAITHWYWLDGGHSGGTGTWITNRTVLTRIVEYDWTIHIHVTPYQIKDDARFWIGIEEHKFHTWLEEIGVAVHRSVHFEDEAPSIENHFRVLDVFK